MNETRIIQISLDIKINTSLDSDKVIKQIDKVLVNKNAEILGSDCIDITEAYSYNKYSDII